MPTCLLSVILGQLRQPSNYHPTNLLIYWTTNSRPTNILRYLSDIEKFYHRFYHEWDTGGSLRFTLDQVLLNYSALVILELAHISGCSTQTSLRLYWKDCHHRSPSLKSNNWHWKSASSSSLKEHHKRLSPSPNFNVKAWLRSCQNYLGQMLLF